MFYRHIVLKHVGKGKANTYRGYFCLRDVDFKISDFEKQLGAAEAALVDHDAASKTFYVGKVLVGNMEHPQELQAP